MCCRYVVFFLHRLDGSFSSWFYAHAHLERHCVAPLTIALDLGHLLFLWPLAPMVAQEPLMSDARAVRRFVSSSVFRLFLRRPFFSFLSPIAPREFCVNTTIPNKAHEESFVSVLIATEARSVRGQREKVLKK